MFTINIVLRTQCSRTKWKGREEEKGEKETEKKKIQILEKEQTVIISGNVITCVENLR